MVDFCVSSDVAGSSGSQAEGFGKLYPSARPSQQEDEQCDDEHDLPSDVISRKELEKGRLSRDGKHTSSIFFFAPHLMRQHGSRATPSPHS